MIDKNVKNKDIFKIKEDILSLKKSLINFNFQKSTGQLEKTSEIKKTKKKIAMLKRQVANINGEKNA
tara:strand:- start:327 stop:527 length:201 start_codon:yes stop_codon:yes gene_type:complete